MPSEAVDVDHGQLVGRHLKDCPVVGDLHELSPVGGRTTGGRDGQRLERFAQMREDLPDRPCLGCNAMSRMLPPHPRALQQTLFPHLVALLPARPGPSYAGFLAVRQQIPGGTAA
jgi:hypothetical protein